MGAAKKIVQLERKAKNAELIEITNPKKTQSKKGKKGRLQPVQELPIDTLFARQTENEEISHTPVQVFPPEQAIPAQAADVATDAAPTNEMEFSQLAGRLTRSAGMTDQEVEAALNVPSPPSETENHKHTTMQNEDALGHVAADTAEQGEQATAPQGSGRDMSKIALFASLAAVILLLGFYVHLNQNIKNLTQQVQDLSSIKTTVSTLDTKIGTMESKVADLETLPAKTRATLMSSILQEMSQKTSYMSTQLESPEQQDKLMKAKELIQQVQTELNTQN